MTLSDGSWHILIDLRWCSTGRLSEITYFLFPLTPSFQTSSVNVSTEDEYSKCSTEEYNNDSFATGIRGLPRLR